MQGKCPAKPSARPGNLLFNPQQTRQRTPWPTSTRDENTPGGRQLEGGGGYASSYCKLRVSRRERRVRFTAMLGRGEGNADLLTRDIVGLSAEFQFYVKIANK